MRKNSWVKILKIEKILKVTYLIPLIACKWTLFRSIAFMRESFLSPVLSLTEFSSSFIAHRWLWARFIFCFVELFMRKSEKIVQILVIQSTTTMITGFFRRFPGQFRWYSKVTDQILYYHKYPFLEKHPRTWFLFLHISIQLFSKSDYAYFVCVFRKHQFFIFEVGSRIGPCTVLERWSELYIQRRFRSRDFVKYRSI